MNTQVEKGIFRKAALIVTFSVVLITTNAKAEPENGERAKLLTLKNEVISAIEKGDAESILKHLHPDVVVTWQNNQVCTGKESVRAFYSEMKGRNDNKFEGYIKAPEADKPTRLYANDTIGVVEGSNISKYTLLGKQIELPNRWSATLIKENDQWLIAHYHVSMNVIDNPLLNGFKKAGVLLGGAGFALGLIGGLLIRRKKCSHQH